MNGVYVDNAENVVITGNSIDTTTDSTGDDGNGVRVGNTARLIISNNVIGNTADRGIFTQSNTEAAVFNNCFYSTAGVDWEDSSSTFLSTENTSHQLSGQGNFTGATSFPNKSLVVAAKGATTGNGTYGGSIAFGRINTASPRAAVTAYETSSNFEQIGLSFWTHDSTSASADMVHKLTLDHAGNLYPFADSAYNLGVSYRAWAKTYTDQLNIADGISAPATETGRAVIFVDSADGDLKIKFGDGTVKTIVTDS